MLINRLLPLLAYVLVTGCSTTMPSYENHHPNATKVAQTIPNYKRLSNQAWPAITTTQLVKPGKKDSSIPAVRQRLTALGDYHPQSEQSVAAANSKRYDNDLVNAMKTFQKRHGLRADGVIGTSTLEALNVSPRQRLAQLYSSLDEWLKLPQKTSDAYIHVNIPSYQLKIIEDNETALSMKVVVGQKKWPTPTLNSQVQTIVINPTWTIPRNIVEKEIVHKVAEDPEYLAQNNINILKSWHKDAQRIDPLSIDWHEYTGDKDLPFRLRQTPGDHNALGRIKFTFPNDQHIYLHDTPHKEAFNLEKRNLSHGCIRLEKPHELLNFLLKRDRVNQVEKVGEFVAGEKTKHFSLRKNLPIYITNISSWVDSNGIVHFSPPDQES